MIRSPEAISSQFAFFLSENIKLGLSREEKV
jgi:hypothetical protein